MSEPIPSPDYLTPVVRWLAAKAARVARALIGQPGINIALAVASAIGVAGGYEKVAAQIHLPHIVIPLPTPTLSGLSRVIVVYESSWPLTRGQVDTLLSDTVRNYLDGALPKDASGRPAWRVWDKDTDKTLEPAEWQNAYTAAAVACAGRVPQVVVFDAAGRASAFPLPDSPEGLVSQLQKAKGN